MKLFLRIVLALAAPLVLLVLGEGALRLTGYGNPTQYLRPLVIAGREVWVENDAFGLRFFPANAVRVPPLVIADRNKGDSLRVVVLGESAAMGDPLPEFGAAAMLEVLLAAALPERRVEVINAAMTAINSHVIREIAHDLMVLKPDVAVLMIGNNEVLGPYGVGTALTSRSLSDVRVRANVVLSRFWLYQRLTALRKFFQPHGHDGDWRGLELFSKVQVAEGSPEHLQTLRRYRDNLQAIVSELRDHGVQVILCTVPVNRTNWPPFASEKPDPTQEQWGAALQALGEGRVEDAESLFSGLVQLLPRHAEVWFHSGHTELAAGNAAAAKAAFDRALDLDALRFRTDTQQQGLLHALAELEQVPLVDVSSAGAQMEAQPNLDAACFLDHVHFTWAGNRVLAEAWRDAVLDVLGVPESTRSERPDLRLDRALVWTWKSEWETLTKMAERFRQPPYTTMFGMAARADALEAEAARIADPEAMSGVLALAESLRTQCVDTVDTRLRLAELYEDGGEPDQALALLLEAARRAPHRADVVAEAALRYFLKGQIAEGQSLLGSIRNANVYVYNSLLVRLIEACVEQGSRSAVEFLWPKIHQASAATPLRVMRIIEGLLQQQWYPLAAQVSRDAATRFSDHPDLLLYAAKAHLANQSPRDAESYLARAHARQPSAETWYYQAILAHQQGRTEEVTPALKAALHIDPNHAPSLQTLTMIGVSP